MPIRSLDGLAPRRKQDGTPLPSWLVPQDPMTTCQSPNPSHQRSPSFLKKYFETGPKCVSQRPASQGPPSFSLPNKGFTAWPGPSSACSLSLTQPWTQPFPSSSRGSQDSLDPNPVPTRSPSTRATYPGKCLPARGGGRERRHTLQLRVSSMHGAAKPQGRAAGSMGQGLVS